MSTNIIFSTLKPICIKILNSGKICDIKELHKSLKIVKTSVDIDYNPLENLVPYVAFPLVIKIKNLQKENRIPNEDLEETLSCLVLLLDKSSNLDWGFFKDVFYQIFLLVSSCPEAKNGKKLSEECQSKVMETVPHLCNGIDAKYLKNYLSPEFRPQLGHAVSMCLHIAENERKISLRLSAIDAVRALGLSNHVNLSDEIRIELAITFASFLPGIATKLENVATAGEVQNHKVTMAAIQSWEYFVVLSLNDKTLKKLIPNFGIVEPHALLRNGPLANGYVPVDKTIVENKEDSNRVIATTIDQDWLLITKEHLHLLIKKFSSLTSHPHWEVRLSFAKLCFALASRCVKSLDNVLIILLENLVILEEDSLPEMSSEASKLIKSLAVDFSSDIKDDINNAAMERILVLIRKLQTIARFQDDDHILNVVQQLRASFAIKSLLNEITLDSIYLDKILLSFATLLTLDCSDPELLQEHLAVTDNIQILSLKPGIIRNFKYFRNMKIFDCICHICHVTCRSFSLIALSDVCIELIQGNSPRRKEGFLLLMLFLEGAAKNKNYDTKEVEASVMSIVDTIVNLGIFNISISPIKELSGCMKAIDNKDSSVSVESARCNVVLLSYALQVLGRCSLILRSDFTQFLNVVLYYLMEKAGDTNNVVSNSAVFALEQIAHSAGYETLSKFIESSVPYFWCNLSLGLKKIPEYPSAPQVLRFTLVSHKIEMNTFIEELVEDILDSLDTYHSEMAVPLMTVLLTYSESLHHKCDRQFSEDMNNFLVWSEVKEPDFGDVIDSLVNYVENQKVIEDSLLERDLTSEPLTADDFKSKEKCAEEKPEEKIIPKNITLLGSILERISYLLSVPDRKMQLICLQIIHSSLDVLHKWEDQKLPLFHKLWKPVVFCIGGKDLVVMLKSIEVSILMLVSSDYFLVSRYLKELFPVFEELLSSQSSVSLGKTKRNGFHLTPGYKLQVFLLEKLPILVKSLDLGISDCKKITKVIFRYIDKAQPYELVQLGLRCLEYLVKHNKYLSWYLLTKTKGLSVITPSSDKLNTITVRGRRREFHEEGKNIFTKLNIQ